MSLLSSTRTVLQRLKKEESGQSLVLVVLAMTVIMGCAAIAIDTGRLHNEQIKVQNATDFAALAAVKGLPTYGSACDYAKKYAEMNCDGLDVQVELIASDTVKVTCTKQLTYTFAKAIGYDEDTITASATARKASEGGATPPAADCYPTTTARMHQWPETGRQTYAIQVDSRHQANPGHGTNRQTLVLCFNKPVTYVSSNGTYTGGNGTCMISIDYKYWNNPNDNIGLGDVYVKCDGNPKDLTVTESIMLCEKGKLWPFVAGETAGSGSDGAVLIE